MKKLTGVGFLLGAGLFAAGLSMAEVGEYLHVAHNRTITAVRDAIPLDVEMDRMEVLLQKLEDQVSTQRAAVARARIALQDAETNFRQSRSHCGQLLSELRQPLQFSSGTSPCASTGNASLTVAPGEVQRVLAGRLAGWKASSATLQARQQAMHAQRVACTRLEQQFQQWHTQRQLLTQRLETLRIRYQTQQLAGQTDTSILNDADLARTVELADQIERQLRIAEAQQELAETPVSPLPDLKHTAATTDIEAAVDAVLSQHLPDGE